MVFDNFIEKRIKMSSRSTANLDLPTLSSRKYLNRFNEKYPEAELVETIQSEPVPKLIFIIPYRNREHQYKFYIRHMKNIILEDYSPSDYRLLFIHQNDNRGFNRGAMKNIGFIYVKNTYPTTYKDITLVFNDIDIMPIYNNIINFNTVPGIIKHFYGFTFALGGLFSIKAGDFEKINGFPNYWGWGYEDNLINKRAISSKLTIDRSEFYEILDKNFIVIFDKDIRIANKTDFFHFLKESPDGINTIYNLQYKLSSDEFIWGQTLNKQEDLPALANSISMQINSFSESNAESKDDFFETRCSENSASHATGILSSQEQNVEEFIHTETTELNLNLSKESKEFEEAQSNPNINYADRSVDEKINLPSQAKTNGYSPTLRSGESLNILPKWKNGESITFINVNFFETPFPENKNTEFKYSLKEGIKPFKNLVKNKRNVKPLMNMVL